MADLKYTKLSFEDLKGWADDDHRAALDVYGTTAPQALRERAAIAPVARGFFEQDFCPVLIEDGADMVFTGYYEPEFAARRTPDSTYCHPIYGTPADLDPEEPYHTRREIDQDATLADQGLELAWMADPVDLFFLQVQGSGRLRLPDGKMMRVGFSAKNGHPYTSVGKTLIARGEFLPDDVSPEAIRAWISENETAGRALLWENKSYVFFKEITEIPADQGPLGAMGHSVTAGRSIAVDPAITPLGAPVWIETNGITPMHRLMVAQDIGSAIKGAQRADIFFGSGEGAGKLAGQVNDGGRMIVLIPRGMAAGLK